MKPLRAPRKAVRLLLFPIQRILHQEATGGMVLLACIVLALILANSPWAEHYHHFWHRHAGLVFGPLQASHALHFWINEGLMTMFFLVVALEIKREILTGELSSLKKAMLPVLAAAGGMLVPAVIYALFNPPGSPASHGWGVPIATDIAFAVGVLLFFGNRIPLGLKVFLLAVAIVDDIGAILVIVLFYSKALMWQGCLAALGCISILYLFNRLRILTIWPYALLGFLLWIAILQSGIHATLAGVLLGFTIPAGTKVNLQTLPDADYKLTHQQKSKPSLSPQGLKSDIHGLVKSTGGLLPPLQRIELALHPWVTFLILPLFALANAGVTLAGSNGWLASPVTLGIIAGLVIGKPLGITAFVWLGHHLGIAALPPGISVKQITGIGFLGGIGFTMSLFIASLSFGSSAMLEEAKIGVLLASTAAAAIGALIIRSQLEPPATTAG